MVVINNDINSNSYLYINGKNDIRLLITQIKYKYQIFLNSLFCVYIIYFFHLLFNNIYKVEIFLKTQKFY